MTVCSLAFGFLICLLPVAAAPPKGSELPETVLRHFLTEVHLGVGVDPRGAGSQNDVLLKIEALGESILKPEFERLHELAARQYLELPVLEAIDPGQWISKRLLLDEIFTAVENDFRAEARGKPPFDHHVLATQWWDPCYAARTLRDVVSRLLMSKDQLDRRRFMDQFAPPRVYRQSDDASKPVLAFWGSNELFSVQLEYDPSGIYVLKRLEWFVAR
ncbi:MAG: hypothetical protein FJ295_07200 [Planctomycetes bacterium]|nr:hypothetical protein [Planctomycetota bacterium]